MNIHWRSFRPFQIFFKHSSFMGRFLPCYRGFLNVLFCNCPYQPSEHSCKFTVFADAGVPWICVRICFSCIQNLKVQYVQVGHMSNLRQTATGQTWTLGRCSKDRASGHGTPPLPTGLNSTPRTVMLKSGRFHRLHKKNWFYLIEVTQKNNVIDLQRAEYINGTRIYSIQ